MNILDKLKAVLNMTDVKLGFLPDQPDKLIALFEYNGTPPDHSFGSTNIIHNVQARTRDLTAASAYQMAEAVVLVLNRYSDGVISIIETSPILDIGSDSADRQEYTVNFEIRRY